MSMLADQTLRGFEYLSALVAIIEHLPDAPISADDVHDQLGQLRVWSRNLGVLAPGPASLDHRLRDAPTMFQNVTKLLIELSDNVRSMSDILNCKRQPFEQQRRPASDSDDASSASSADTLSSTGTAPQLSELEVRLHDVENVITHLFKLSVKIRSPGLRPRHLKAASFRQIDSDTGSDLFDAFASFDSNYVIDAVSALRKEAGLTDQPGTWLTERLAATITLRRKKLAYWQRHHRKLAAQPVKKRVAFEIPTAPDVMSHAPSPARDEEQTLEAPLQGSSETPNTILSATQATTFLEAKPDHEDNQSDLSMPSTALDSKGRKAAIPPAPVNPSGKEFECSLCFAICPFRYSKESSWRSHVIQDLEPYVCTIENCVDGTKTYASRKAWLEHEKRTHRAVWRCPNHPSEIFRSRQHLEQHLNTMHSETVPPTQLETLLNIAMTWEDDHRTQCPVCGASVTDADGLHHHLASHLERFAVFALPMSLFSTHNEQAGSNESRGARMSRSIETGWSDRGEISWHSRSDASSVGSLLTNEQAVGPISGAVDKPVDDRYTHEPVASNPSQNALEPRIEIQSGRGKPSQQYHEAIQPEDPYLTSNLMPMSSIEPIDEKIYWKDPRPINVVLKHYLKAAGEDLTPAMHALLDTPQADWTNISGAVVDTFNSLVEQVRSDKSVGGKTFNSYVEKLRAKRDSSSTRSASQNDDTITPRAHGRSIDSGSVRRQRQPRGANVKAYFPMQKPRRQLRFKTLEEYTWPGSEGQSGSDDSVTPLDHGERTEVRIRSPANFKDIEQDNSITEEDHEPAEPGRSILKKPTSAFPEFPDQRPTSQNLLNPSHKGIPAGARWTKIDRALVNPQSLTERGERFEEREKYVIVLRVLNKQEIQDLADRTQEIRKLRQNDIGTLSSHAQDDDRIETLGSMSASMPNQDHEMHDDDKAVSETLAASEDADELWEYIRNFKGERSDPNSTIAPSETQSRRSSIKSSVGGFSGAETPLTDVSRSAAGSECGEIDDVWRRADESSIK